MLLGLQWTLVTGTFRVIPLVATEGIMLHRCKMTVHRQ